MIARTTYEALWRELAAHKPMVFMAGPRQAGKTTLARAIAEGYSSRSRADRGCSLRRKLATDRRRRP